MFIDAVVRVTSLDSSSSPNIASLKKTPKFGLHNPCHYGWSTYPPRNGPIKFLNHWFPWISRAIKLFFLRKGSWPPVGQPCMSQPSQCKVLIHHNLGTTWLKGVMFQRWLLGRPRELVKGFCKWVITPILYVPDLKVLVKQAIDPITIGILTSLEKGHPRIFPGPWLTFGKVPGI